VIFVGVDWAEAHHDVCILDGDGTVLGRRKIGDSFAGVGELHALVAAHLGDDDEVDQVVVGIEKDRGLIVTALVAANYQVYGINPMAAARYRERHHVSGSKSDPGDAKMLADLVDRSPEPPPGRGRQCTDQRCPGARASPPERHLGPATPGERVALGPEGLLPGRSGGLRD